MDRTRWIAVVAGATVVVVLVAASTSGPVPIAERAPRLPFALPELDTDVTLPTPTTAPARPSGERSASAETAEWVTVAIELALMLVLLTGVLLVAKRLWQRRPATRNGHGTGELAFDVLAEVAEAMVDDAEEQRAILRTGEPRNAIVECWLRVETIVTRAGLEPDPSDTTAEYTSRVLDTLDVDGVAVERIADLYREARFSTHAMGETHRSAALEALDAIHAGLRRERGVPA